MKKKLWGEQNRKSKGGTLFTKNEKNQKLDKKRKTGRTNS
jgi:hypothetical protein